MPFPKHFTRECSRAFCRVLLILSGSVLPSFAAQAQTDTITYNIRQIQKRFLEQNLLLLAQHYQVEAGKALVQQAKRWDNPTLTTDQNIYAGNRWLEHGTSPDGSPRGQYFIQLEQLIRTAGKRGRQVDMARTNVRIGEAQFNEVMLQLRFQLRSGFYTAARLLAAQELYEQQRLQLEQLIGGMESQLRAGDIARKDLLRIQAMYIALQQDISANLRQMEDIQSELRTLLRMEGNIWIKPVWIPAADSLQPRWTLGSLIDTARLYNTAYRLEQLQVQYQQQNLSLQKALAVPDIAIAPSYDLNSNYAPRYVGLGISLPVPVLNGNKGNIKAARWQLRQQEALGRHAEIRLSNSVTGAYNKYRQLLSLNTGTQEAFYADYQKLQSSIAERFRQRQIGLLEFIDSFNDYKEVRLRQLEQQLALQLAKEELNLQVGTDLFSNPD